MQSDIRCGGETWSVPNYSQLFQLFQLFTNYSLVAPLVIPTFLPQINLDPVTLSNTIQNGIH